MQGKKAAREALRHRLGLTGWGNKPLVGVVTRLTEQKGGRPHVLDRPNLAGGCPEKSPWGCVQLTLGPGACGILSVCMWKMEHAGIDVEVTEYDGHAERLLHRHVCTLQEG